MTGVRGVCKNTWEHSLVTKAGPLQIPYLPPNSKFLIKVTYKDTVMPNKQKSHSEHGEGKYLRNGQTYL